MATISRSNIAIIKLLLDYRAKVDTITPNKRALLLEAIRLSQGSKVSLLMKYGANVHIVERQNIMNLLYVVAKRNVAPSIFKIIIDTGVYVDS